MGGILASANIDALKHKDFWQGVHVAIVLGMIGLLGVCGRIDGYACGTTLTVLLTTVWGIKARMARKANRNEEDWIISPAGGGDDQRGRAGTG